MLGKFCTIPAREILDNYLQCVAVAVVEYHMGDKDCRGVDAVNLARGEARW